MASAEIRLQRLIRVRDKKRADFFEGGPPTLEQMLRAYGYDQALQDQIEQVQRELKGRDTDDDR